jgi:chromosomal replication initiator protein
VDRAFEAFLKELKRRVKPSFFKKVQKDVLFLEFEKGEGVLRLQVKDKIVKELMLKQFKRAVEEAAQKTFGAKKVELLETAQPKKEKSFKPLELDLFKKREKEKEEELQSNLNPKYTFENFIVGASNQFAHAAALAVAENPGKAYNPLFIYGGVGLGKTHLMQAIGNYIKKKNPWKKVIYITTESFMNQLIEALKSDTISTFREKFRNIDVLLIDDIQFIGGKERTQIEFFHTFNALYDAGKQVVLTSDRPPKDIPTLTERLRSRFEWGLIADIQPPDFETRVAILKRKAELEGIEVSDKVIKLIATIIKSNIRQLEGALIKLKAKATLEGKPITEKLVRELFAQEETEEKEKRREVSLKVIKEVVSSELGVDEELLLSSSRKKQVAFARQVAMYLAKKVGNFPYTYIAASFNRDDHTTVLHAVRKLEELRKKDPKVNSLLEKLEIKAQEAVEGSNG